MSLAQFGSPPTRRSARIAQNPPKSLTSPPGVRTRRNYRTSPTDEIKPLDYGEDETVKKNTRVASPEIVKSEAWPPAGAEMDAAGEPSASEDLADPGFLPARPSRSPILWALLGGLCWLALVVSAWLSYHLLPGFEIVEALALSQMGVLCFALAYDWWKKAFVISTMFVLAPALWLQFRGLDLEPAITLMHIISSVYFHAVQDVRKPAEVHVTNETAAFLDYFWASLDIISVFIYVADIPSRVIKAFVYLVFVYVLLALLFKGRQQRMQLLSLVIFVGGLCVVIGRYSITRQWPILEWRFLLPAVGLLAYAAYNFLVLQDRCPEHYWLHHGLWHLAGNASFLLFLYLRTSGPQI